MPILSGPNVGSQLPKVGIMEGSECFCPRIPHCSLSPPRVKIVQRYVDQILDVGVTSRGDYNLALVAL